MASAPQHNYVAEPSVRVLRGQLTYAARCEPTFTKARVSKSNPAAAHGIRYERRVHRALDIMAKKNDFKVEHNPWFKFNDQTSGSTCSPDALLWPDPDTCLVIEVKYTWVVGASVKLKGLYIPVVNEALQPKVIRSVVICKTLTPQSPQPVDNLEEGTSFSIYRVPTYQWLGQGPIVWSHR